MTKHTFGIRVGVNKFIEASSQTEQDRLAAMHQAMRLTYISENTPHAIASARGKQTQNDNYDIHIMRDLDNAFQEDVTENIGRHKQEIHQNLQKTLNLEDGMEQLNTYISVMEQKYDPDIVAERREEPEVEQVYETSMEMA